MLQNSSGHGAFPVMEPSGPAAERSVPPQQHLDLLTVTFDKVKNSIGLSIIEAVVSDTAQVVIVIHR